MANVELLGKAEISPFRKIAIGTWQTAYDPSIYGTLKVRADLLMEYIERFRTKHDSKITVTHLVAKAVGMALGESPEANAFLRFNSIYQRKTVDISVLVLMEADGKKDLSAATLRDVDKKSLVELSADLKARAEKIRNRQDKELEQTRQSMGLVPAPFINLFLKFISFLNYSLNLNLKSMGVPKDAFGSAIVTSIGSLGLEIGYVPLVPYSRVPIYVAPGVVKEVALVDDGKIVIGKELSINVTFDHRIIDGGHAADLSATVRRVLEDPFNNLDPLE